MKKLLFLLLLISFSSYSQNNIVFRCYKVNVSPLDKNIITTKNIDVKFTIDFKNQNIILDTYNPKTYSYDSLVRHYFRDDKNEDSSHSYFIMDYTTNTLAFTITVDPSKSKIYLLDSKNLYTYEFANFEIIKD